MVDVGLVGSVTAQYMVPVRKGIQNYEFKMSYLFKQISSSKGYVERWGEG